MDNKMTYQELVDKIAEKTGRPKNLVDKLIHEMIRTTTEGLQQDQHITVRGLGRYRLKWTKARQGRNPQTGDPIEIAAHNRILFKPNVSLREFINREYAHLKPELLEEQKEQPAEAVKTVDPKAEPAVQKVEPAAEKPATKDEPKKPKMKPFWWILIVLLAIILVVVIIIQPWKTNEEGSTTDETSTEQVIEDQVEESDVLEPALIEQGEEQAVEEEQEDVTEEEAMVAESYATKPGDQLMALAFEHYGQTDLWPLLYHANADKLTNPDVLSEGTILNIPQLEAESGNYTASEIDGVAEGYIEVYLAYKEAGFADAIDYLNVVKSWNKTEVIDQYSDKIDRDDL